MATATVLHPSSTSYPPPPSYSSGYSQPGSNMISAAEPRKNPEDNDPAKRQSLPSISEVISGAKSTQYPPPTPANLQSSSSFPSPFAGPLRSYAEAEKRSSPQPLRSATSYPSRQEPHSSFTDSPRASFTSRPNLPSVSERRPSPTAKAELPTHHYPHDSPKDPRSLNGGYPHHHAPPPPPQPSASATTTSYPTGPLPHGQMPLPSYPASPRHAPMHGYPQYDQRATAGQLEDGERGARPQFEHSMYSTPWTYGESLARVSSGPTSMILRIVADYFQLARSNI